MKKINDGGPAFPQQGQSFHDTQSGGGLYVTPYPGMTLRDYFAAKAIGFVGEHDSAQKLAIAAYQLADAMLAAREQSEQQAE